MKDNLTLIWTFDRYLKCMAAGNICFVYNIFFFFLHAFDLKMEVVLKLSQRFRDKWTKSKQRGAVIPIQTQIMMPFHLCMLN